MATEARQMTIDQEMYERMAGSSALYERAKETFPSGVTHDARFAKPFPIYVNRAKASRKWDVDDETLEAFEDARKDSEE